MVVPMDANWIDVFESIEKAVNEVIEAMGGIQKKVNQEGEKQLFSIHNFFLLTFILKIFPIKKSP